MNGANKKTIEYGRDLQRLRGRHSSARDSERCDRSEPPEIRPSLAVGVVTELDPDVEACSGASARMDGKVSAVREDESSRQSGAGLMMSARSTWRVS